MCRAAAEACTRSAHGGCSSNDAAVELGLGPELGLIDHPFIQTDAVREDQ